MKVWAPYAKKVELICSEKKRLMQKDNDTGWWYLKNFSLKHGDDYAFFVDDRGPFPDPRSSWQPNGVHGFSRYVDHSLFEWKHDFWHTPPLGSSIIYECHIGTFTEEGTFDSAIKRLDHLLELGINYIEIMPVSEFPGNRGWGYDGVDIYAPHHSYGGPDGLKRFIDACHGKGISVILDVVYNHLGPDGNYLSQFGPYFTKKYSTPWGEAVNFDDGDSDEVRRFFIDNAIMWITDYRIDGLRLDAIHAIFDSSAMHFLEALSLEINNLQDHLARNIFIIAESDLNDPKIVRSREAGGYGLDAQWNDDFHHALHSILTGEKNSYFSDFGKISDLSKALSSGFVFDGQYSNFRKKRHGRQAKGLSGRNFIGFIQNHDQIGNRPGGERISHLLTLGQLKIAAAILMMSPFIPMLFQGEEWGATTPFKYFTNHQDPELGEAVSKGRLEEHSGFKPDIEISDPQEHKTFIDSKLNWCEKEKNIHNEIFSWYKDLILLRKSYPELTDSRFSEVFVKFNEISRWLIIKRSRIILLCNFTEKNQSILCNGEKIILLSSEKLLRFDNEKVELPRHSVVIFLLNS